MSGGKIFGESRKWLNPLKSNDTGMMSWIVCIDEWSPKYVDVSVGFWDCGRKIDLDLGFSTDKQKTVKERAAKINTMISELEKVRDNMSAAYLYSLENPELNVEESDDETP